jgi:hypothetical protein
LANDDDLSITLDGKSYSFDDFELGDLEWLEEYTGRPLSDTTLTSMKAAVGFVYLIKRRDDPSFTIEQARKLKLNIFKDAEVEAEPAKKPRPTRAG